MRASEDPAVVDRIMHCVLTTDTGFTLMASDTFGMLTDRFGIHWMMSIAAAAR